jgi:hypothetical protein
MATAKPIPYTEKQPYIFVSYAHKDAARVMPLIEGLQRRGMRVWYDNGINPGKDWAEELSRRLLGCHCVVCFVSRNFLASQNCVNEINMASNYKKHVIPAHLEPIKLPPAMELTLGHLHAVSLGDYGTTAAFLDNIANSSLLRPCCTDPSKLSFRQQSPPAGQSASHPRAKAVVAIAAAAALIAGAVFAVPKLLSGLPTPGTSPSESTGASLPQDPAQPYRAANVGDEVRLGNYDWIVLDKQPDKLLVISKYSIGLGDFVDKGWEITWDISGVREYLNDTFLNGQLQAGEAKTLILPTRVTTPANPTHGTTGGADVTDKLFLLSYEEVLQYMPDPQDRLLTTQEDPSTSVVWWLRTMGRDMTYAMCVDAYGELLTDGNSTSPFSAGFHYRPAMWINIAE